MAWQPPSWLRYPLCWSFAITFTRHTTFGRTPLDEWSARRRDLYLTTHNTHNRQPSMPPAAFEPAIPASERRQTHALERAATGIDEGWIICMLKNNRQFLLHDSIFITKFSVCTALNFSALFPAIFALKHFNSIEKKIKFCSLQSLKNRNV
jgi:hypothetical protein